MDGSVAAPTAGLHFTDRVLKNLAEKKVSLNELTLHVGAGTFQPVKTESISDHTMHNEKVIIPATFIEALISQPEKIIAVGTTSVRSLESLYWLGVKLGNSNDWENEPTVSQWDPYELSGDLSPQKALKNILTFLEQTQKGTLQFSTQLIIVPGYTFRLINGMITNFHQPQSTLLLLISAFLGDNWKDVYRFALENEFRFLSYGDSNLYLK
jgi:S-adenosylmethionine:tRNA ribosyltransferase-isomerase